LLNIDLTRGNSRSTALLRLITHFAYSPCETTFVKMQEKWVMYMENICFYTIFLVSNDLIFMPSTMSSFNSNFRVKHSNKKLCKTNISTSCQCTDLLQQFEECVTETSICSRSGTIFA